MSNPKNNKKLVKDFCTKVFVNYDYTLKKIVAERDLEFIHFTTTATHTGGDWLGVLPRGTNSNLMLLICSVSRTANCRALGRGGYLQPIKPVGQNQINFHKLFLWYCTYVHVT